MLLCVGVKWIMTKPDLSNVVQQLSQYMSQPTDLPGKVALRILKYLKSTVPFQLHFPSTRYLQLSGYSDADWGCYPTLGRVSQVFASSCVPVRSLGRLRNNQLYLDLLLKQSTNQWLQPFVKCYGSLRFYKIFKLKLIFLFLSIVIICQLCIWFKILSFMRKPSMLE